MPAVAKFIAMRAPIVPAPMMPTDFDLALFFGCWRQVPGTSNAAFGLQHKYMAYQFSASVGSVA